MYPTGTIEVLDKLSLLGAILQSVGLTTQVDPEQIGSRKYL
jgi:hypothetical protein